MEKLSLVVDGPLIENNCKELSSIQMKVVNVKIQVLNCPLEIYKFLGTSHGQWLKSAKFLQQNFQQEIFDRLSQLKKMTSIEFANCSLKLMNVPDKTRTLVINASLDGYESKQEIADILNLLNQSKAVRNLNVNSHILPDLKSLTSDLKIGKLFLHLGSRVRGDFMEFIHNKCHGVDEIQIFGSESDPTISRILRIFLTQLRSLKKITIPGLLLPVSIDENFYRELQPSKNITDLVISRNRFEKETASETSFLSMYSGSHSSLTLHLHWNKGILESIRDKENLKHLSVLDLHWKPVYPHFPNLKRFTISNVWPDYLSEFFKTNPSIETLEIGNLQHEWMVEKLSKIFESADQLKRIELSGDAAPIKMLQEIFKQNQVLSRKVAIFTR